MTIRTRLIELSADDSNYQGFLAWDDSSSAPRPGILVSHTIRGRTDFEDQKAIALAELGYVALSLDLYGAHTRNSDIEIFRDLMNAGKADRPGLQQQMLGLLVT